MLAAGGANANGELVESELYDVATATWTSTGSMANGRYGFPATLLPTGKGLAANSRCFRKAFIFATAARQCAIFAGERLRPPFRAPIKPHERHRAR